MAAKKPIVAKPASVSVVIDQALLKAIADATYAGGHLFTTPEQHGPLLAQGLVEINPDPLAATALGVPTRATVKAMELFQAAPSVVAVPQAEQPVAPQFQILNVPMPVKEKKVRGSGKNSIYPFDELEVGQMFFVAGTPEKPNTVKAMASTVSAANRRYQNETGAFEQVEVKQYLKGPDGKKVVGADGKFIQAASTFEMRKVTVATRTFVVREYELNGVKGAGIWRTL